MREDGLEGSGSEVPVAILDTASACCLVMQERGCNLFLNGVEVSLLSASRSAEVTTALLDIGLISLNLGAPGILNTIDLPRCKTTVALLLDYATEIAPRMPGDPDVIDGAAVIFKARDMRARFLDPATDPDLIQTIGVVAQLAVDGEIEIGPETPRPEEETREQ